MADSAERAPLPRYLAPLPRRIEDIALRYAWAIVAVNLAGTAFGFWYYRFQFAAEPLLAWPIVPDSPTATLFIAGSFALWRLGRPREWLNALAFFGCLKLGLWTPIILLLYQDGFAHLHPLMYHFLFWSHLAMVLEGFVIHRFSAFPHRAITVAAAWYAGNDLVDYFVPIIGDPHHTWIPPQFVNGAITHPSPTHELTATVAVSLTVIAISLALATNHHKRTKSAP